jgi:hypothetical protein
MPPKKNKKTSDADTPTHGTNPTTPPSGTAPVSSPSAHGATPPPGNILGTSTPPGTPSYSSVAAGTNVSVIANAQPTTVSATAGAASAQPTNVSATAGAQPPGSVAGVTTAAIPPGISAFGTFVPTAPVVPLGTTTGTHVTGAGLSQTNVPSTSTPVVIGGIVFHQLPAKTTTRSVHSLSKSRRATMPQAELVKLRGQSIASLSKDATQKIRALPLTFDDPKQLNYIQLLDSTMAKCVKHLQCFDMLDVFQIVFPDANGILEMDSTGTTARSVSLFTHFTELEVGQVAASNRWYNTFTNDAVDQAATNLDWSYTFFSNNIEAGLMGILSERYNRYPEEEQGGPLLYMLLMKELFFVAKQTAKTLHAQLKRYRIDKIPGENIKNVSTIVMSVSRRIWFSKKKEFPDDYIKTVLQLYQTSSVARFNDHFKSLQFD